MKLVRVEELAFGDERAHEGDDPGAVGDEEDVLNTSGIEVSELADDTDLPPCINPVDEAKQEIALGLDAIGRMDRKADTYSLSASPKSFISCFLALYTSGSMPSRSPQHYTSCK